MFVLCYAVIKPQEGGQERSREQLSDIIIRHKLQNVAKQSLMTAIIRYVIL